MPVHSTFPLVLTAAAIACSTAPLGAQEPLVLVPVRASQVMTPAQLQETGVAGLTREQRIKLDGWLTRYTAELRRAAGAPPARTPATPSDTPAPRVDERAVDTSALEAVPDAGDASAPQPARQPRRRLWVAALTVPPGAPLVATPEDGSYVRLADGTLWEVYLPDRTATELWRRGDYIAVSRAAAGVNGYYDHELINAPARTRAYARFVGLVSRRR